MARKNGTAVSGGGTDLLAASNRQELVYWFMAGRRAFPTRGAYIFRVSLPFFRLRRKPASLDGIGS